MNNMNLLILLLALLMVYVLFFDQKTGGSGPDGDDDTEEFNYQAQLYPWTVSAQCYPCCNCRCASPGSFDAEKWIYWHADRGW